MYSMRFETQVITVFQNIYNRDATTICTLEWVKPLASFQKLLSTVLVINSQPERQADDNYTRYLSEWSLHIWPKWSKWIFFKLCLRYGWKHWV